MRILGVLLLIAMLGVVAVLLTGVWSFVKGGPFYERYGNRLMQARVGLQLVAALLLGLMFMTQS